MADVADDRAGLDRFQHVLVAHVDVTGGGHDHVHLAEQVAIDGAGLAGVFAVEVGNTTSKPSMQACVARDRIDLGNFHNHAFLPQALRGALAHIAVANDQRLLAGQQHVGATLDAVIQTVAAAIFVVVLALGHRVIDVDGRDLQ